jgi:hypothetical protein
MNTLKSFFAGCYARIAARFVAQPARTKQDVDAAWDALFAKCDELERELADLKLSLRA